MFWNKSILKEKKEINLVNRILDLIELDSTEISVGENHYNSKFSYPFNPKGNIKKCCNLYLKYNGIEIYITYVQEYITNNNYFFVIDNTNNGIQISENDFYKLKDGFSKQLEKNILVSLYPFKSSELEIVFNDVQKIQDGAEQIEFITNEIKKIKETYNK